MIWKLRANVCYQRTSLERIYCKEKVYFSQKKSFLKSKSNLGRAGRTQPGECYRLFTRCNQRLFFEDFLQSEMVTSRLDNIYLQAKLLNISNVKTFLQDALDPPSAEAIEHAEKFLYDIGALTSATNQLTPIGRILAQYILLPEESPVPFYTDFSLI